MNDLQTITNDYFKKIGDYTVMTFFKGQSHIDRRACWGFMSGSKLPQQPDKLYVILPQESLKDIELLEKIVSTINKITPCKLVDLKEENITMYGKRDSVNVNLKCVQYQALGNYKKDLFLCNFIRYTWQTRAHSPVFRKRLLELKYKDPFLLLISAQRCYTEAEASTTGLNGCNHSNVLSKDKVHIKGKNKKWFKEKNFSTHTKIFEPC